MNVAVLGPGLMGVGIAQVVAAAGCSVRLVGRDSASAAAGRQRLAAQLQRQVQRGRIAEAAAQQLLGRVHAVVDEREMADCTLAIESVPEDRALKLDVLRRLERTLPSDALIATNTSGLPISGLAKALAKPERFLGLHFFSPVERMPLVEVVRGPLTSADALSRALAFVRHIGKTPIVVADGPGFFTSRVFAAYLDEALALVGEGVPVARIDAAGLALGRAIGPLALLDEVSLALNLQQAQQARADGLPPERCRLHGEPVLAAMVAAGRRGRRDGGGFYDTAPDGSRTPWPGVARLFSPPAHVPSDEHIARRLRLAEVLEALRCLEAGVVASADDADSASLLGLGFPAGEGGVLAWAERRGLLNLVAQADELERTHGARFGASPWLRLLAVSGQSLPRSKGQP